MLREFILLFKKDISWANITKYLGKDFQPLENSREEMFIDTRAEGGDNDCHITVNRGTGLVVNGNNRVRVIYDQGVMSAGGQEFRICELHISCFSGRPLDCVKLALKLAKKYDVLLESRTHSQRAADLISGMEFGRAHVKSFSAQKIGDAMYDFLWWHLCGISQAAGEFILRPAERLSVRRLRVEIRKLRAVLTVLDTVFTEEADKWQEKLRELTIKLARPREIDVALADWRRTAGQRKKYNWENDHLMAFMCKERIAAVKKIAQDFQPQKLTVFLLEFMLWALADALKKEREDTHIEKIVERRIVRWYKKMVKLVKENTGFIDDLKAHEVRIKAKAIRYVIQSMSGQAYGDNSRLLRHLKRLQDALGGLHDNYINEKMAYIIARKETDRMLIYQAGLFAGVERAETVALRRLLPGLWKKFTDEWEKAY